MSERSNAFALFSAAIVLLFFTMVIGIPMGALLRFSGGAPFDFFDPSILAMLRFTVIQAGLSVGISVLIGIPLGLWIGSSAHARDRARSEALLSIPFSIPTVIVAAITGVALGRQGWLSFLHLDWLFSVRAIVAAHVFMNAPWIALRVSQTRAQVPREWIEAARSLGASALRTEFGIAWPAVRSTVVWSALQAWSWCAMSFAIVLLIGGGPPAETLETAIYHQIRSGELSLAGARACALWELLLTLIPSMLVLIATRKDRFSLRIGADDHSHSRSLSPYFVALIWLIPLAAFILSSPLRALSGGDGLGAIAESARISAELALMSASVTLVIAFVAVLSAARCPSRLRAFIHILLAIPSGISALVLGLGFWLAYASWVDPFEGSLLAIVLVQSTILLPWAFRALWPLAMTAPVATIEAARVSGATAAQVFRYIEWPRWRGTVISVFTLAIAFTLGEVAAVSLFYSEKMIPLSLQISRLMSQYRFDEAQALSAALLIVVALLLAVPALVKERGIYGGA